MWSDPSVRLHCDRSRGSGGLTSQQHCFWCRSLNLPKHLQLMGVSINAYESGKKRVLQSGHMLGQGQHPRLIGPLVQAVMAEQPPAKKAQAVKKLLATLVSSCHLGS